MARPKQGAPITRSPRITENNNNNDMMSKTFVKVLVALLLLAACCLAQTTTTTEDTISPQEDTDGDTPNDSQILDFVSYQKLFGKVYGSYTELLRRSQLFYARLCRIFIVGVRYLKGQSSSYLKASFFSDRTEEERLAEFANFIDDYSPNEDSTAVHGREKRSTTVDDDDIAVTDASGSSGCMPKFINSARSILRLLKGEKKVHTQKEDANNRVYLDYRDSGCLTPVKHQKHCGACYIFSVIVLYEYHHCIQTGNLVPFSEQYILDCGSTRSNKMRGCFGGLEWETIEFAQKYGLELGKKYPYQKWIRECPYANGTDASVMGSTRAQHATSMFTLSPVKEDPDVEELMSMYHAEDSGLVSRFRVRYPQQFNARAITSDLERFGPLAVGIRQSHNFFEYGGGVDQSEECYERGGHSMAIVGHGIENGHEYFLIKNSQGLKWGLKGYYKLSKRMNARCFVRYGYVEVKFSPNESYKRTG